MSAAAIFTPGSGDFHVPVTVRLADLPRGQQLAAWRVYSAILDFLPRGKTELGVRYTDRVLRQSPWLRDYSRRFIQKGLKILTELGIIRRQFSEGRRIIIVTGRLRGRTKPAAAAGDRAGTGTARPAAPTAARPASIPNVGIVPPTTPEQLAAAAAAQDERPGPPPSAEDQAAAEEILRQSRARREAAAKAKARADARGRNRAGTRAASTTRDPIAPGTTAQAILEARRQDAGLRIAPDPDPDPGSPPRRDGP